MGRVTPLISYLKLMRNTYQTTRMIYKIMEALPRSEECFERGHFNPRQGGPLIQLHVAEEEAGGA